MRTSSDGDLSGSSGTLFSIQHGSREGFSDGPMSSVAVQLGSPKHGFSRAQSSKLSEVSVRSSVNHGMIAREQYRRTSTGRQSVSSIGMNSNDAVDIGDTHDEIIRLRRALELTHRELSRTEAELSEALITLSREREENRKRDKNSHLFYGIFRHGGNHVRMRSISPSRETRGQPSWGRRRSGSCPNALASLPQPTVLSDKFNTIKHLIDTGSLFPIALLGSIVPNLSDEESALSFGYEIEKYMLDLVSSLRGYRSHNSVIRNAIVAITPGPSTSSAVSTRDVCKTLKNHSGLSIPDVTSIIRVSTSVSQQSPNLPTTAAATTSGPSATAMPLTPTAGSTGGVADIATEDTGTSGTVGGIGIGGIIREKKSTAPVISLPPRQPKKRGRPSNRDRGLPPPPKRTQPS